MSWIRRATRFACLSVGAPKNTFDKVREKMELVDRHHWPDCEFRRRDKNIKELTSAVTSGALSKVEAVSLQLTQWMNQQMALAVTAASGRLSVNTWVLNGSLLKRKGHKWEPPPKHKSRKWEPLL